MSATATPDTVSSEESVVDGVDLGGSPGGIQADGESNEPQEGAEASKDDEGEEPESQEAPSGVDPEEYADLQAELEQHREIMRELNARMERDPAFRKMLEGGSGTDEPDLVTSFRQTLTDVLEPDAAAALDKAFTPILDRLQKAEARVQQMEPRLQKITHSLGSQKFQSSLAKEGVTPAEQKSPEFQRHLKRLRKDGTFQSAENRDPRFAAQYAASTFIANRARTTGWRDDKARLATARTGKGGDAQTARSSTLAEKIFEVVKDPSIDFIAQAHAIRQKNPGAKIRYVDPK